MKQPLTKTAEERSRVATLRRFLPPTPEGWKAHPRSIQRVNTEEAPGIFSQRFVSGLLRLTFVSLPPAPGHIQITLSRYQSEPSAEDIERVGAEWFSGRCEATTALDGLVFFRMGWQRGFRR